MGVKVSEQYPSEYISAEDLDGKRVQVQIEKVEVVEVDAFKKNPDDPDEKVKKLAVAFVGKKKTMLFGPKNSKKLGRELSDDVDDWIGKVVEIWSEIQDVAGTDRDVMQVGIPQETVKADDAGF